MTDTKTKTDTRELVCAVRDGALTVPNLANPWAAANIVTFGDTFTVDSEWVYFDLIDDIDAQADRWGHPRFIPTEHPSAAEIVALRSEQDAESLRTQYAFRIQQATTAAERERIRQEQQQANVDEYRASFLATTTGRSA